ncbi:aminotransferase-like domain-containing protein [Aliamphritea hakodatensis]|uniref:aminotransferase-like domain-containing protein n=1 Tax=Aliamphritea hakodatensis TaxID=2895352 RepID=UPI0022FD8A02|nr:PLP-dependent aminotransferase family protein [Aliamphritea hakodatensis]
MINKIDKIAIAPNNTYPIYMAVANQFEALIKNNEYIYNERLPALRLLAEHLGVALDTVKKAYSELESRQLVYSRVGSGTYVKWRQAGNAESTLSETFIPPNSNTIDLSLNEQLLLDERGTELSNAMGRLSHQTQRLNLMTSYQAPEHIIQPQLEIIARFMNELGIPASTHEMLLTSGAQQGLHLILQYLLNTGDVIVTGQQAYPGVKQASHLLGRTLMTVSQDADGLNTDDLESLLAQQTVSAVYVTPEYDNPTAAVMSLPRRERLAELAREHNFLIIEDGALHMPQNGLPSLYSLAPGHCIYLFSFSKILAGGLRLGSLLASGRNYRKMVVAQQSQYWMVSPFLSSLACDMILHGAAKRLLDKQIAELENRFHLCHKILGNYSISGSAPGYHIWLALPEHIDADRLAGSLKNHHVEIAPSKAFCMDSTPPAHAIRISLAGSVNTGDFVRGLEIIRECLEDSGQDADWSII